MKTAKVTVLPYSKSWQTAFEMIRDEIKAALGDLALAVEHVGSTAVAGMSAKPCIDIDVVIADRAALAAVIDRLATVGYEHEGDLGICDREAFKYANKPHLMQHHLYVCPKDSAELHRHLTFRDFLKNNAAAALQYSKVKEEAARLFPNDIDRYIAYKSPCIQELYRQCGLEP